jgi:hypothetical protein
VRVSRRSRRTGKGSYSCAMTIRRTSSRSRAGRLRGPPRRLCAAPADAVQVGGRDQARLVTEWEANRAHDKRRLGAAAQVGEPRDDSSGRLGAEAADPIQGASTERMPSPRYIDWGTGPIAPALSPPRNTHGRCRTRTSRSCAGPESRSRLSVKERLSAGAWISAFASAFPPFTACSPTPSCGCRHDLGFGG